MVLVFNLFFFCVAVPLKAKEPENSQSGVSQFLKELSEKNKSNFDQVTKGKQNSFLVVNH